MQACRHSRHTLGRIFVASDFFYWMSKNFCVLCESSTDLVSSLTCVLARQGGGRLPAVAADLKHLQPAAHHGWRTVLGRIHAGKRFCRRRRLLLSKSTPCHGVFADIRLQNRHLAKVLRLHQLTLGTDGHYYSGIGNALRVDPLGTWFKLIIV